MGEDRFKNAVKPGLASLQGYNEKNAEGVRRVVPPKGPSPNLFVPLTVALSTFSSALQLGRLPALSDPGPQTGQRFPHVVRGPSSGHASPNP